MPTNNRSSSLHRKPNSLGFTLIEVLVALVIFAVLSALSYRSLSALLQTRERVEAETTRWREVMLFFNRLDLDLRQSVNRPITIDKTIQPAWVGKTEIIGAYDAQLMFSRLGTPEQNGLLMDTQRVGYRYNAGKVEILLWPALDIDSLTKPSVYTVLSGVKSMSIRYMQHQTKAWLTVWPSPIKEDVIPKAIEVEVTLLSGETLNRIYNLR